MMKRNIVLVGMMGAARVILAASWLSASAGNLSIRTGVLNGLWA